MSLKSIGYYAYCWAPMTNQGIQLNFKQSYDTEQSKLSNMWPLLLKAVKKKVIKKTCQGQLKYCLLNGMILSTILFQKESAKFFSWNFLRGIE